MTADHPTSGEIHTHPDDGNAYDGLADAHLDQPDQPQEPGHGFTEGHWAFGTDFEDPLAGVDTTIPVGVDAGVLGRYSLMLGDDALVLSQRISEWCSNAPDLEDDIAVANIALDLLGQARLLLARAAAADPALVPSLPADSPVPEEDALAFFREAHQFLNVRLVEVPNGDFADVICRILLFSVWRLAVLEALGDSADNVLRAVAIKGSREVAYHRDYAARWFLTLAQGTEESRCRLESALAQLWPLWPELFAPHATDLAAVEAGVGVDPASVQAAADAVLDQVLAVSGVERPDVPAMAAVAGLTGRDGMHTEALSRLLMEMQVVARAHPMGQW